ncbi:MAG: Holliday junction DNA helicase RuvB C-terminal domain-containing protein, partial [Culicoidibacterales bacterium]
ERTASIFDLTIEPQAAVEIGRRSRGTPRIANRIFRRVRDFAQVFGSEVVTTAIAQEALTRLEIDEYGLDHVDHKLLIGMIERFRGGPVGLEALAASIAEEAQTIEDVYEPFLLQEGFIQRTPRGRMATRKAYEHLQLPVPEHIM